MKSPITLNWPGVVVLVAVLAVIALIEIFGDPGAVTTLVELVLLGVAGGTFLPASIKGPKGGESKRPRRPPPLPLLLLVLSLGALAGGCGGGVVEAASGARTARDIGCRGGRWVCRWTDRACRLAGGPWVVPRSPEEVATDAAAPTSPLAPVVEIEGGPASEAADAP